MSGPVISWARKWWRALLAEVVSTGLLVWLGCASCIQFGDDTELGDISLPPADTAQPALAFGFIVTANMCAFGAASGAHMNPAVTLGALLYGQLDAMTTVGYIIAQVIGSTLGFGVLLASMPKERTENLCLTMPAKSVSPFAAVVSEVGITGTLLMAVCHLWASPDPNHPDHTGSIKIGLVVAGLIYSMGAATGASLNPARSFGPALLQGAWQYHWVYWLGPMLGGALGSLLHRYVLTPMPTSTPPPAPTPANNPSPRPRGESPRNLEAGANTT